MIIDIPSETYIQGGNIVSDLFKPRLDKFSRTSLSTLEKYGNWRIKKMWVRRKPIPQLIERAMKFISSGKSHAEYDKFFHLSLICNVGPINIIVEKNEEVHISTEYTQHTENAQFMNVSFGDRHLDIGTMMLRTIQLLGNKNFYDYEAFSINCQHFIISILKANNLLNPVLEKFILQPMEEVIKTIPNWARTLAQYATTSANVFSKLTGGVNTKGRGVCCSKPANKKDGKKKYDDPEKRLEDFKNPLSVIPDEFTPPESRKGSMELQKGSLSSRGSLSGNGINKGGQDFNGWFLYGGKLVKVDVGNSWKSVEDTILEDLEDDDEEPNGIFITRYWGDEIEMKTYYYKDGKLKLAETNKYPIEKKYTETPDLYKLYLYNLIGLDPEPELLKSDKKTDKKIVKKIVKKKPVKKIIKKKVVDDSKKESESKTINWRIYKNIFDTIDRDLPLSKDEFMSKSVTETNKLMKDVKEEFKDEFSIKRVLKGIEKDNEKIEIIMKYYFDFFNKNKSKLPKHLKDKINDIVKQKKEFQKNKIKELKEKEREFKRMEKEKSKKKIDKVIYDFEDMNVTLLRKIAIAYNNHLRISNIKNLNRSNLITILKSKLEYNHKDGSLKVKKVDDFKLIGKGKKKGGMMSCLCPSGVMKGIGGLSDGACQKCCAKTLKNVSNKNGPTIKPPPRKPTEGYRAKAPEEKPKYNPLAKRLLTMD